MDLSDADILLAYRSQGTLEHAFRQMKDPHFVRVRSIFHWADHKIRLHIAICVVALMVASRLYRKARQQGFDHGFDAWMETRSGIPCVVDLPLAPA